MLRDDKQELEILVRFDDNSLFLIRDVVPADNPGEISTSSSSLFIICGRGITIPS